MKDAGRYGDQYVTVQIDVPKNLQRGKKKIERIRSCV